MSGINRPIVLDSKQVAKHLPDTPQMQRLLRKRRAAHVFNDEATMNRVARAIIENGEFTDTVRGYDRYGMLFAEPIGYRISPDGSRIVLSATVKLKSMKTTNTTLSPELDPVKDNWEFTEVWMDPALSPPYILLLLAAPDGRCRVYDPAEGYRVIFESDNYDEAQFWLLEDEYEPLEGRRSASELI